MRPTKIETSLPRADPVWAQSRVSRGKPRNRHRKRGHREVVEATMNGTDEIVGRNRVYAAGLGRRGPLAAAPTMRVAIVTCMDARIETGRMLGLEKGA